MIDIGRFGCGIAGETTPQQLRYLGRIKSNADRLTWHINELLDLARIGRGREDLVELRLGTVHMEEVVSESVESLKLTAESAGLSLEHRCEDAAVLADRNRVVQIITNLVMNSIKYSDQGDRIDVIVERLDDGFVLTSIRDTGKGIASEDVDHIFERYYRASANLTFQPGAGLGLPISKQLVELQGGKIWVESEEGVGSTFSFTLPESVLSRSAGR